MKRIPLAAVVLLLLAQNGNAQRMLTLEQSRRYALDSNATIKHSTLAQEAAHQTRQAALTLYFPTISAGGFKFESQKSLVDITTQGGNLPVYDGTLYGLLTAKTYAYLPSSTMELLKRGTFGYVNILQPIFAGGRIINGNRLASVQEDVREYQNILAVNNVLLQTEEGYWRVVSLEEKYKTIERYEEMLAHLSSQVEDSYRGGLVLQNDLLKIKLKQNELLLNKSKLENGKKLAKMAFCQFIGIPYDSSLVLGDTLDVDGAPQSVFVDHKEALKKRAEYVLLEKAVDAERIQSRMKLGEYLPEVSVGVSGIYQKLDETDKKTYGVAYGTVSIPISKWWEASHTLQERGAQVEMAETDFKNSTELLLLEMEKSWEDLTDAFKQVALSAQARAQAEVNLKVNQDTYKGGVSTITDLLDAQAMVQQTNADLIDAKANYRTKHAEYLSNTGRYASR